MDDIFCKIISGEIPSHKVYEDENVLAILDINYVNPGHTLIIHKEHHRNLLTIPEDKWLDMAKVIHKLSPVIKEAMDADGMNLVMNAEAAGHQVIFHIHAHLIPRIKTDGIGTWPQHPYKEGEAEVVLEKIKSAL